MPSILCRESMTRRSRRMLGFIHRWQGLENFRLTQNYRACNVPQDGFRTIRRITMRAAISGAVENIELKTNTMWAVSQATFMRRVQVDGALFLHDEYGWCSGGFLADSNTDLMTDSGSQQQWLSRNCNWKAWMGANWNMVFVGTEEGKIQPELWPVVPYTEVEKTEAMQENRF